MTKIDLNKLTVLLLILALAGLTVYSGYRLEIGVNGLKLENNLPPVTPLQKT
jgi:hypothetical protein